MFKILTAVALLIPFTANGAGGCLGNWIPTSQLFCITDSLAKISDGELVRYESAGFRMNICTFNGDDRSINFGTDFSLLAGRSFGTDSNHFSFDDDSKWTASDGTASVAYKNKVFTFSNIGFGHHYLVALTATCQPI